jgi:pimeloyl-ACP methyl ester carboxylesterase
MPDFRTASFDKVGYGRSEPATGPVARRRELRAVVDALGWERFHLVGCSNGGSQALDFALEYPEEVLSLTLVNAPPSGWQPQGEPPAQILAMIEALQRGDLAAASELQLQIWFDGPDRRAEDLSATLSAARSEAALMNRIFVERGTFFVANAVPCEPLDPPALGRLAEVKARTLVVDGRLDWPDNRRASRALAEGIPPARLVEVDAAHVPPLEDPEGFAEILLEFLKS